MNQFQSPFASMFKDTKFFKTRDGLSIRYAVFKSSASSRGSILLLSGWTEFLEKYGEPIAKLLERGFDVYGMDWRGQGGSSRSLSNREKGYVNDYSEFVGDLHEFVEKIMSLEATGPFILMAHSMGGNISIQFLYDHPETFEKAVFCCPMFDLPAPVWMKKGFGMLAATAKLLGLGGSYILGGGNWKEIPFEKNLVTSDPERYAHDLALQQASPELRLSSPTYTWLSATLKALKRVNSMGFLENIRNPILLLSGTADQIVSIPSQKFISSILPQCEFVSIQNGRHELLRESDVIQEEVWKHIDRFLKDL